MSADRFPTIASMTGLQAALNARPSKYKTVFWDDFSSKSNGALGTAGSGQSWSMTGAGTLTVSSGKAVNNGSTSYMSLDSATETIRKMSAKWTFQAGDTGAVVVLITGPTNATLLGGSAYIHVICSRSSMSVQVYTAGAVVNPANNTYTFNPPLPADGVTELTLSCELVGTTLIVALPDGRIFSLTDSRFVAGGRAIWEIDAWNGSGTLAEPRFMQVSAFSRTATEPIAPYVTREETAQMIAASNSLRSKEHIFTPAVTGWHRIVVGTGNYVSGLCMISGKGAFLGSGSADVLFSYHMNPYEQGMINNINSGAVNNSSISQVRTSFSAGVTNLDININTAGVPLSIIVFGLNTGLIPSVIASGVTAGTAPMTYNFNKAAMYWGQGSPEGVQSAVAGSLYINYNGGAGTTLYVKESGIGSTGWIAK